MVEFLNGPRLAEDDAGVAVETVAAEGLDDDGTRRDMVVTEEGRAGPAGAEDLPGLVAFKGKRLERLRIEGDGPAQRGQGGVPVAPFQGGAIDVVVRLGPRDGIGYQVAPLLESLAGWRPDRQ